MQKKPQEWPSSCLKLIEVKGFDDDSVNQLRNAIGQYIIYQTILKQHHDPPELYLAVSETAYAGIL